MINPLVGIQDNLQSIVNKFLSPYKTAEESLQFGFNILFPKAKGGGINILSSGLQPAYYGDKNFYVILEYLQKEKTDIRLLVAFPEDQDVKGQIASLLEEKLSFLQTDEIHSIPEFRNKRKDFPDLMVVEDKRKRLPHYTLKLERFFEPWYTREQKDMVIKGYIYLDDSYLAKIFLEKFERLWEKSKPVDIKGKRIFD